MSDLSENAQRKPPRIWDISTRLGHWLIVLAIPAMWWTAENNMLGVHVTIGTVLVGFLIFRLSWGVWGSTTSCFAHFIKGPGALFSYLGKLKAPNYQPHFGHNPMGGLSVIAILFALCIQLGTGLFSSDTDGLYSGPLNRFVSYELAEQITEIHELAFNILLALIALHIGAVLFYLIGKKTNLIRPMVTGRMTGEPSDTEKAELKKPGPVFLVLSLAIAAVAVAWLMKL